MQKLREVVMMKQVLKRREFLLLAAAAGSLLLPFSFPVYSNAAAPSDRILKYIRDSIGKTLRPHSDVDPLGKSIPLPYDFNVPCISIHFQNLFYYDTYFLNRGLIALGDIRQAENNVNDVLFLVESLGFMPNSNRLDMTNRSQPPYLCMMVKDVYAATGNKEWLKTAYPLISKEYEFWNTKRSTTYGLSRHHHDATPEYLANFYEHLKKVRLPLNATTDEEKISIAGHRLAEAEAGYDFTPRFDGRCSDFIPVDLNSNLYLYEVTMADFARILENGESKLWVARATERKKRIDDLLWNETRGLYLDYDMENKRSSNVTSVATFQPLWVGCASIDQANSVKENLKLYEYAHGVVPCEAGTHDFTYQWDYPNAWPPHALIISEALSKYNYEDDADRIRSKYVNTVYAVYKSTGTLWEKYNAVEGNLKVNEEYKTPPMIGWTAGIYAHMRIVKNTRLQ
ncbi:MAG: alpha,alpha-trehalase [Chitinophagales bacterium]|nr:alpha,alpha-trehalase [Chitinophagales bacterium]